MRIRLKALIIRTTSCIRGHHVYKNVWTPTLEDELECRREGDNDFDQYPVSMLRKGVVVGHLPRLSLSRDSTAALVDFLELLSR